MKVVIIGVGLIGVSLALKLRSLCKVNSIFGIDSDERHIKDALSRHIIDDTIDYSQLDHVDMVIVSTPVDASLEIVPRVLDLVHDEALVFDVGSTKQHLCEVIRGHSKRRNFLATHPVAGNENSGPGSAQESLFDGTTNIICEVEMTGHKIQDFGLALFSEMGMVLRFMDPVDHDRHMAYISHLSHISSFMLGKTVMEGEEDVRNILDFAKSGFEGTARLAKSSPAMWTPIFSQNGPNVISALEKYIANLENFKRLMVNKDYEQLFKLIENANRLKEMLDHSPMISIGIK